MAAKRAETPQANEPLVQAPAPVARKATGSSKLEGLDFQIDDPYRLGVCKSQ